MFTIRQLEALYWVVTLGGFNPAAEHLNVSQSAISKRVAEIEAQFPEPLFDRSARKAVLTTQGRDLLKIAERMLQLHATLVARARRDHATPARFAIGMTDLVALSWMPDLVKQLTRDYPDTELQPEIDLTRNLIDRLQRRELDLTICPMIPDQRDFMHAELGNIELCWLASPSLTQGRNSLSRDEILELKLLTQSSRSVLYDALKPIISNDRLPFKQHMFCNNMAILAELASAGLGITLLPAAFFRRHIETGRLMVVHTDIELPSVKYFVSYHVDYYRAFSNSIRSICQSICDFEKTEPA